MMATLVAPTPSILVRTRTLEETAEAAMLLCSLPATSSPDVHDDDNMEVEHIHTNRTKHDQSHTSISTINRADISHIESTEDEHSNASTQSTPVPISPISINNTTAKLIDIEQNSVENHGSNDDASS